MPELEVVAKELWNKLSEEEKLKRCKRFCEYVGELKELGAPIGLSNLVYYAKVFQTPVPKFDFESSVVNFDGYN